jgi:hypothetical protein
VTVNGITLLDCDLYNDVHVNTSIPLLDDVTITVSMQNKHYVEKETAVIIDELYIDDVNVAENIFRFGKYHTEFGELPPMPYLGFNGTLTLHIPKPFYRWRHDIKEYGWYITQ